MGEYLREAAEGGGAAEIGEQRGARSDVHEGPGLLQRPSGRTGEVDSRCGDTRSGHGFLDGLLLCGHLGMGSDAQDEVVRHPGRCADEAKAPDRRPLPSRQRLRRRDETDMGPRLTQRLHDSINNSLFSHDHGIYRNYKCR